MLPPGSPHIDVDAFRRVRLLGALRIENAQGAVRVVGSKTQSLFAYLLLHPSVPHTRETLADRLWPESPPDRVRRNFSDTLYRLRQTLGSDWLLVERDRIALRPKSSFWVDVW
jgi:DNA-binding SARP family transcriptional activator